MAHKETEAAQPRGAVVKISMLGHSTYEVQMAYRIYEMRYI
ncbi:hypothetical protein [Paenibacillus taiwanensis]|nr:hypothetical protein [Paenibacillus taiwanensis]